jgi:hypothetical protein
MQCKKCDLSGSTYDNKCVGCRYRLVKSAYPDKAQGSRMFDFLEHATRIDRATLYKEFTEQKNESDCNILR